MSILLAVCTVFLAFAGQTMSAAAPSILSIFKVIEEDLIITMHWTDGKWTGKRSVYIMIKALHPTYFAPSKCPGAMSKYVKLTDYTAKTYKSPVLEPATEYQVSVSTKISGKWSGSTVQHITTDGSPPPIEGLTCNVETVKKVLTLVLKWKTPCKAGSNSLEYDIEVCKQRAKGEKSEPCEMSTVKPVKAAQNTWQTTKVVKTKMYDAKIVARISNDKSPSVKCTTQIK